jgi:hypothetical protein
MKLKKSRSKPTTGDLYLKGSAVYKLIVYNETDDMVLLGTTNEKVLTFGNIRRVELREKGFHLCPLDLREPALQVFELDKEYTPSSLKKLEKHVNQHLGLYNKLSLPSLMADIIDNPTRKYIPPKEQADQYPQLKDQAFDVLVPFYCLSKEDYKHRYRIHRMKAGVEGVGEDYEAAISYTRWPIIFVPPTRFT